MLASRAAGFRLGVVILLLMVPIVYFGTVLGVDAFQRLRMARANEAAVDLLDMTFRTMTDLASGWSVSDQQNTLLLKGPALAQQAGVSAEFKKLKVALLRDEQDRDDSLAKAAKLVSALSDGPLMNDAGNREANALAAAGGMLLPDLLNKYREMQSLADGSMHISAEADRNAAAVATLGVELARDGRALKESIVNAAALSSKPIDYEFLLRNAGKIEGVAAEIKTQMLSGNSSSIEKMQHVSGTLREAGKNWLPNLQATWFELQERLAAISKARIQNISLWTAKTLGWSVLAVVFGLGVAINMFRKTLTKLDQVELARREADAARREAEDGAQQLEKLNVDLASMNKEVSQHLKSLEDAQVQLVKKGRMEQMGQLTATMAHELRNPLGAARTSVFLLERKTRNKGLGVEGQIQRITTAIMRCDDIISQLLDFSRTKKLSPTSADFDSWLEKTVTEEAMRLPTAVSIALELGTAGRLIAFDPARMHRALTNLLNNASEAMVGNGDDSSKFAVAAPCITIRSAIVEDRVELSVSDNGPGIAEKNLAQVREPLFTTKSFGTGLGLPAVEQIAAQHGGSMDIRSEVGKGTTALIRLPLETVAEAA